MHELQRCETQTEAGAAGGSCFLLLPAALEKIIIWLTCWVSWEPFVCSIRWLVAPEFCHREGSPQDVRPLCSSHGNIYSAARWLRHDPDSQIRSTCCIAPANPYHNIPPAERDAAGRRILLQENRSLITHMIPITPQCGKRVTDQCTWLLFPIWGSFSGRHAWESLSYDVLTVYLQNQNSL